MVWPLLDTKDSGGNDSYDNDDNILVAYYSLEIMPRTRFKPRTFSPLLAWKFSPVLPGVSLQQLVLLGYLRLPPWCHLGPCHSRQSRKESTNKLKPSTVTQISREALVTVPPQHCHA